jgi:hypothetical protein
MLFTSTPATQRAYPQHPASCDFCRQTYFNDHKRENKKKNGFPLYLLCQHCYDWSLPKKSRKLGVARVLKGSPSKQKHSGEAFSKSWSSAYRRSGNASETVVTKDPEDGEKVEKEEVEEKGMLETVSATITNDVKVAVNIIESGFVGLVSGAADALGLSKKDKKDEKESSPVSDHPLM